MKQEISKYSDAAKTILAGIAMILVTGGYYDAATAQMLVGAAMGIGTAFWQVYDIVTTKRLVKETKAPVEVIGTPVVKDASVANVKIGANTLTEKPYATPNKVM